MTGFITYFVTEASVLRQMPDDRVDLTITWVTGDDKQAFLQELEELGVIMLWENEEDIIWRYRC